MKEVAPQWAGKINAQTIAGHVHALDIGAGSCSLVRINSLEDEFQSNLSDTRATGMPDALAEIARFDDSSEGIERAA